MYLAGAADFASFATGTIVVVLLAMVGSLTVLPALLSKMGEPHRRRRRPHARRGSRPASRRLDIWGRITDRVLRRPLVSAVAATGLLLALALPGARHEDGRRGPGVAAAGPAPWCRRSTACRTPSRARTRRPRSWSRRTTSPPAAVARRRSTASGADRPPTGSCSPARSEVDVNPDRTVAQVTVPTAGDGFDDDVGAGAGRAPRRDRPGDARQGRRGRGQRHRRGRADARLQREHGRPPAVRVRVRAGWRRSCCCW